MKKLEDITEVTKASPAIHVQNKMTLLQLRAWNVLLANAYDELPDKDIHTVSVGELAAKLEFNSGNRTYLKTMLKSLQAFDVEWNLLNRDNQEVWGVASLLASVEIENGICTYGFAPHLRKKLYDPKLYAKLNLRLQNEFSSRHALILWEVCFDYLEAGRDQGETPFIPLVTFKKLIGMTSGEYPSFGFLNRDVVKPSIQEINRLTNYRVEVDQKRVGRQVRYLRFRIARVEEPPVQESGSPDINNLPPVAVELVKAGVDQEMAEKFAANTWSVVRAEKLPPSDKYSNFAEYVSEKIEMSLETKGITNRGGYIVTAIRENYQDPHLQEKRQLRAKTLKKKALDDLKAEFMSKRNALLRQALHDDPQLLERAAGRIQGHIVLERLEEHDSVLAAYQKGGIVTAEINYILTTEFCAEPLAPVIQQYEDDKAGIEQKYAAVLPPT